MKLTRKLCQPALALLFAVTIGTAQAWAQKSAEEKIILPPSPPPPLMQPSPPPTLLPFKPVEDKLAAAGWTRYEIGEPALFSLLLPSEPGASVVRMKLAPGLVGTIRTYLSATDSGVYSVYYIDGLPVAGFNDALKQTLFETFFKDFTKGFEERMKADGKVGQLTMLEQRTAASGALKGYERDFSFDKLQGRFRVVFDAGRAYAVVAVWNGLSSNSERTAFFESLRITKTL